MAEISTKEKVAQGGGSSCSPILNMEIAMYKQKVMKRLAEG